MMEFMKEYYDNIVKNHNDVQPFIDELEREVIDLLKEQKRRCGDQDDLALLEKRKQLVALGLYLQQHDDLKAMDIFKSLIWKICEDHSWALPTNIRLEEKTSTVLALFAVETAQMLAEFLVIYQDEFEQSLMNEITSQVQKRVLNPFAEGEWIWKRRDNKSIVYGSCLGITAFIIETNPQRLQKILRLCNQAVDYYFRSYGSDGACVEGITHWAEGFSYYHYFADLYGWIAGVPLLDHEKVAAIVEFPFYLEWKPGHYVPFSEATPKPQIPSGLLGFLGIGSEHVTSFHFDQSYSWAHLSRILWWSTPIQKPLLVSNGTYFEDAQWLVFRNNDIYFAAKGGHNQKPHHDVGHFVLSVQGELVLTDLGSGVYTANEVDPRTRSSWHSVPIIDEKEQISGMTAMANVEYVSIDKDRCQFSLDIGKAYGLNTEVRRKFNLNTEKCELSLIDELDAKGYQMNFVSYEQPELLNHQVCWRHLTLTFNGDCYDKWVDKLEVENQLCVKETVYRVCFQSKEPMGRHEFKLSWVGGD